MGYFGSARVVGAVFAGTLSLIACQGPRGPQGPPGPDGDAGPPGNPGNTDGGALGADAGLAVSITVSAPVNGQYFTAGEHPILTIQFANQNGPLRAADLGTANLYLYGPRLGSLTKTDCGMLNCVAQSTLPDGGSIDQHHYINLTAPNYAAPAEANLSEANGGTLTYTLSAVGSELPGTYTAAVWATTTDDVNQVFQLADLQIKSATVETYSSGPTQAPTCYRCHLGPVSGKSYQAHITPGFSPFGNYALDQTPIANCKACHNLDGFSSNTIVRKVHGAHRGSHQLAAGVAHPEYGMAADDTLGAYLDVIYPSLPDGEKDCGSCHADARWKTNPARLACGSCHDNVYFDTGIVNPPTVFGPPPAAACAADLDCAFFGPLAACNTGTGSCEQSRHPVQSDDSQCGTCHTPDVNGLVPIARAHEVYTRTQVPGLKMTGLTLSGSHPANTGVFVAGDTMTLQFALSDATGPRTDLLTNATMSGTLIIGGPTDDVQRIFGNVSMKKGCPGVGCALTADGGSYTYVVPTPLPAVPLAPEEQVSPTRPNNPPGTYTVWAYVSQSLTSSVMSIPPSGASFDDVGDSLQTFQFSSDPLMLPTSPPRAREVISQAACQSCHFQLQVHGGSRRQANGCSLCHSPGAVDLTVGAKGISCSVGGDATCPGFAGGWEACFTTYPASPAPSGGGSSSCYITVDPTPGPPTYFAYAAGTKGPSCTVANAATMCPGTVSSPAWEGCYAAYSPAGSTACPGSADVPCHCYVTVNPAPGQPIDFRVMIHEMHFARLRGGYAEQNNLVDPGQLTVMGFQNSTNNFQSILFPQDVRNCTMCHTDSNAACSVDADCGIGQSCPNGACVNTSWQKPSAMVCTSCHDTAAVFAHATQMTTTDHNTGLVTESCDVCHGPSAEASVAHVHNIANPYVPPYQREPAP